MTTLAQVYLWLNLIQVEQVGLDLTPVMGQLHVH